MTSKNNIVGGLAIICSISLLIGIYTLGGKSYMRMGVFVALLLFFIEMIDRYDVIGKITTSNVDLDKSQINRLIIIMAVLMVLRAIIEEVEDDTEIFKLIGGMALLFTLFGRRLMRMGSRQFI